ncbi:DUF4956 domain-containing protein [Streptococcus saliviloxodontae]|uniref:DUF4956 domain-containing protein n=1 Tax=Streptococcus saliviloxodontae TaxID=1349416 RepID=A0ABS2PMD4_9STRE|nr:DUF4956 domain-containing protein [Streptococcus saliviloxodontae]MBM7636256.1 hypothetical protein [Streptococcus saliviloxodontae]
MSGQLFNSVFKTTTSQVNAGMLALALLVSLALGFVLSWIYKYRSFYTREFVITLTLLPSLMTMIIFLVNGNLGTGVAVAGAFGLVRFRSATSGSRELLAIFLAMIVGLASGMGYLTLSIVLIFGICSVWFCLEKWQSYSTHQTRRLLTLTSEWTEQLEETIQKQLQDYCVDYDLLTVATSATGQSVKLIYEVEMKAKVTDLQLTQALLSRLEQTDIKLTKQGKKKKNL